nr:glyoxalase [Xanthomonas vasicola]
MCAGADFHLAFAATGASAVDGFHRAALQHGGHCNGTPGVRPDYGDDYYAAFVIDPDGHPIEAVVDRTPTRQPAPPLRDVGMSVL